MCRISSHGSSAPVARRQLVGMLMVAFSLYTAPASGQDTSVSQTANPAVSSWLYGTDGEDIFRIRPDSGQVEQIGRTHNRVLTFNDIAETPDGEIFLVTTQALYRLDPNTGVTVMVGGISGSVGPQSLISDASGRLWGSAINGQLMEINRSTGAARVLGNIGAWARDLALAPDGSLYGVISAPPTGGTYRLIRVDNLSGRFTVVGSLGYNGVGGLAFGPDGRLYGSAQGATLITIDLTSGLGTPVAILANSREMTGLAARPFPASTISLTARVNGPMVHLSWTGVPGATSYVLDVGSAPGTFNLLRVDAGQGTSLAATAPPGVYYVRVRGRLATGAVEVVSNETQITVGACMHPPAPVGLVSNTAAQTLTLTWNPVTAATSYLLEAGTGHGQANALVMDIGSETQRRFSLVGVPTGTYFVRVRAMNACGASGPSNESVVNVR